MSEPFLILDRALDVHHRLRSAGIDSAIGGALCLGYHVDDPRGTQDIDVNVSLPAHDAERALQALPPDVPWDDQTLETIARTEQVRIMWPIPDDIPMPLDLFFMASAFHEIVRDRAVTVPMRDRQIRILSATDLTIFKALFDRPKDWPDIHAMLEAHDCTVDLDEAIRWVSDIVGERDPRTERLRDLKSGR